MSEQAQLVEQAHCAVCSNAVAGKDLLLCAACSTPHHIECWRKSRGCASEGCRCRICESPQEELVRERDDDELVHWFYPDGDGSLIIESHAYAIEDALGGLLVTGCLSTSAGYFLSAWAYTMGWYAQGTALILFLVVNAGFRRRLRINAFGGAIERSLLFFDRKVSHERDYLFLDELVELHLHSKKAEDEEDGEAALEERESKQTTDASPTTKADDETNDSKPIGSRRAKKKEYSLYAVDLEGERKLMFTRKTRQGDEVYTAIEQIARAADVTVRHFTNEEQPSPRDIAEAVRQRRLEAHLSEKTAGENTCDD